MLLASLFVVAGCRRNFREGMSNLVQVGAVVVLTTGHTTTTGMLAVLSYTTVSGRDVAATVKEVNVSP